MKKIIGLDLGTKTLGIAITDSLHIAAHGYENFLFEEGNYKKARQHVLEILNKEDVDELCIGLPLHMSGETSKRSESTLRFRDDLLVDCPNLKIAMVDERMTSIIANNRLLEADLSRSKRKAVIDKMSAVVILESYMEMRNKPWLNKTKNL
ncbi:MAG: Holliday junction resolvase RuvX [Bacteroidia bacterium]|nr:Holliday junction resolvase RuvX [Bacteroidia bacterium]